MKITLDDFESFLGSPIGFILWMSFNGFLGLVLIYLMSCADEKRAKERKRIERIERIELEKELQEVRRSYRQ